jgi:disulfide bond formation protein DsbB
LRLLLRLAFLAAIFGTVGSLFFSEVLRFPPCTLCWYQRIFLFPLVAILGTAIWTEDSGYAKYALPLACIGLLISVYHNLIYYGLISEALSPCTQNLSCSAKQLELFGFVTIPLLSLICFLVLALTIALEFRCRKGNYDEK